ncbi:MAG: IMP dehydrogenase, partial [Candidatus Omnitrophica bacterium]|nr:IMP dehydrogenase [Candidatus Omnitrophota bacterium]
MGEWIGKDRKARRCYGFDEIALVPGTVTINPDEVDISWEINGRKFPIPFLASAMDGVVDPKFAIAMGKMGCIAVLNLEGIYTRYDDYEPILDDISKSSPDKATELVQKLYLKPIKEKLIAKRIHEIKKAKVPVVVSTIPQHAEKFGKIAEEAGCDIFVIQSTVTTVRHISKAYQVVDLKKICKQLKMPVIVGNSVTYQVALELMETGVRGLLI